MGRNETKIMETAVTSSAVVGVPFSSSFENERGNQPSRAMAYNTRV